MLVVKTYISPSKIHGCGVFAAERILAGSQVWIYNPIVDCEITEEQINSLPPSARELALSRTFVNDDGRLILSRDNAVFFNHSEEPNTEDQGAGNIALRDIEAGEELTESYRKFGQGACNLFLKN